MSKQHTDTLTPEQRKAEWEKLTPEQKKAALEERRNKLSKELVEASKVGDVRQMQLLLNKGADINFRIASYLSPLVAAAQNGKLEAIKFLVSRGATLDLDTGFESVSDPIGNTEVIKHLLSIGTYNRGDRGLFRKEKLESIGLTNKDFVFCDLILSKPSTHINNIKNDPAISANLFKIVSNYGVGLAQASSLTKIIANIAYTQFKSAIKEKFDIVPFYVPARDKEFMESSKDTANLLDAAGSLAEPNNIKTIAELESRVLDAYDKSMKRLMGVAAPKLEDSFDMSRIIARAAGVVVSPKSLIPAIHWAKQNPEELKELIEKKESVISKASAAPIAKSRVPSLHNLAVKAVAKMVLNSEIELETEIKAPKRKLDDADLNEKAATKEEGGEREVNKPRTGDEGSNLLSPKPDPMSWEATVSSKDGDEKGLGKTRF